MGEIFTFSGKAFLSSMTAAPLRCCPGSIAYDRLSNPALSFPSAVLDRRTKMKSVVSFSRSPRLRLTCGNPNVPFSFHVLWARF